MRRVQLVAWTAVTLVIGGAMGVLARDVLAPPARAQVPPGAPTLFEYQTASAGREPTEEKTDKLLNLFAKEGWRYAGYLSAGNLIVFERPRASRAAPRPQPPRRPPEEID